MRAEPDIGGKATSIWRDTTGQTVLILAAAVVLLLVRMGSTSYYSNDAAQYWSTISNLLQGHGIRTSAVYYEVQAAHGLPAHQTVWPPGMPLFAAGFAWATGLPADRAVAVLNALAHGATALLIYWLVAQLRGSRPVAAAFAVGYLLYAPSLIVVLAGLSEPFSTLATVTATCCVAKAFAANDNERLRWLTAAAAAIGIGCSFRYQVVFMAVPLGLLCLAVLWRHGSLLRTLLLSAMVLSPAAVAFAILLARNWLLTGTATGGNAGPRGNTLAELAFQAKWAVLSYFGGGSGWLDRGLIVLFVVAAVACVLLAVQNRMRWQIDRLSINSATGFFAIFSALLTTTIIVTLASRSTFYTLEGRYFHASVLLGAIALIALWPRGFWTSPSYVTRGATRLFALAAAALVLLQLNGLRPFLRQGGDVTAIERALATTHNGRSVGAFLRASAPAGAPIMSNQSQLLHLVLQRPTFSIPERRLTPTSWKAEEIIAAARRFAVTHVVVFPRMPLGSNDGSTDYVWQMAQQPPLDLEPLLQTADVAVFTIKPK